MANRKLRVCECGHGQESHVDGYLMCFGSGIEYSIESSGAYVCKCVEFKQKKAGRRVSMKMHG